MKRMTKIVKTVFTFSREKGLTSNVMPLKAGCVNELSHNNTPVGFLSRGDTGYDKA